MSETTQLVAMLGMLGSQFDGEVLNAARMAERLRRKIDKTWGELLLSEPKSDGMEHLLRAMRAERMVLEMSSRVTALESELARLREANAAAAAAQQRTARPGTDKYALDAETEDRLIDALLAKPCTNWQVLAITKWPRVHLRLQLSRIAKRRGLTFDMTQGHGHGSWRYRFYR